MRALLQRVGHRLGYRGMALLVCGIAWLNWGLGLLMDPRYGTVRGASALTAVAPMPVWAWAWIGTGVLSCSAAVLPSSRDWWGWAAATAMPVVWAAAYTSARALGEFPQGLTSGLTWLASPALALIVAASTRRLVHLRREVATLRRTVVPPAARGDGP
ncbi:hypothetical protein ACFQ60_22300 [Streptomyces zhihengii]|uniref:Uncharacterized protein n=1 Tax=Streptomyces zhihengii TaxID=1818004 RepID=A0ABS2UU70_9ACTN|nr:hypothetical protein [Streptomyces zhihengii]MBM9621041.1 hypothetical protein [Streptomyces zhihengii]